LLGNIVSLFGGRNADVVSECRRCGASVDTDAEECPNCGSDGDIVDHRID
jgi:ribosomal protein L37E